MALVMTDNYEKVLAIGIGKAIEYNHDDPSTEYILIGILVVKNSTAIKILNELGINKVDISKKLCEHFPKDNIRRREKIVWSPRALQVIYLAQDEAKILGSNKIGTEHLLLALIREQNGIAGQILIKSGTCLARAREIAKNLIPPEVT